MTSASGRSVRRQIEMCTGEPSSCVFLDKVRDVLLHALVSRRAVDPLVAFLLEAGRADHHAGQPRGQDFGDSMLIKENRVGGEENPVDLRQAAKVANASQEIWGR